MDVLFAAHRLIPAQGGAERFALELLAALSERGHRVRAIWIARGSDSGAAVRALPPGVEGTELAAVSTRADRSDYWRAHRDACGALESAVRAAPKADVVVTQLHGVPAGVASGVPAVVLVPSYESLCKSAFGAGAVVGRDGVAPVCELPRDCWTCPAASVLPEGERIAMRDQRRAQDEALARAHTLVACSHAMAAATRSWTKRAAEVVAPVGDPPSANGRHGGHTLVAAAGWVPHKGVELVEPIVRGLRGRSVVVTDAGLSACARRRLVELGASLRDEPLGAVLEGAGACIVASQWPEPFCRTAFEAQACGVPVVAPRTGGLPEHVAPCGLIDPDAGAAAYVAAVRALDDAGAWAAASAAARTHAAAVSEGRPLERAVAIVERAGQAGRAPARARRRGHG
ncbi:MAG: glycogen synthase [Solirubrobacteraceae bacterium]|nr:glycogen synthase [Solirubrobacteraceae bacterium]